MFVFIWAILLLSVSGCTAGRYRRSAPETNYPDCEIKKSCTIGSEKTLQAEAGLCAVMSCSVTTEAGFEVKRKTLHKCNGTADLPIFSFDNNKENIHPEYEGRVSLLQFDQKKRNYSIIINDLTESDSGLYYVRATGSNGNDCKIICQTNITVKDLDQKPAMLIPRLTEGQQTTLTCTAPGFCSGSDPKISWTWRAGGNDSYITGNITAFKTENLTAGMKRHNATLTFNSSAELHSTEVTCKVSFKGGTTTEETKTLNVTFTSTSTSATVKNQSPTTEKCFRCNDTGDATTQQNLFSNLLLSVQKPHSIILLLIGFVMGTLLSAIIACLVIKCLRKKQKRTRFLAENVELMIAQSVPMLDNVPEADHVGIHVQHAAEGGAESSGPSAPDGDLRPKEAEYSDLDFSLMKRRNPTEVEKTQDMAETEYAEIKKEATEEWPHNGVEDGEVLEGNEKVMIGEDEEAKEGMAAEEEGGKGVVLYSNVNEVIDEI